MNVEIHSSANCESTSIGEGTNIGAFSHILRNAKIGRKCNIHEYVYIQNEVLIGDFVTIQCGVQLWDGMTLEDNVFVGANVTFANNLFPHQRDLGKKLTIVIQKNVSIGANATILAGITIGQNAVIEAGAVVVKSIPANAIVAGNPAKIIGYVNSNHSGLIKNVTQFKPVDQTKNARYPTSIPEVNLYHLPVFDDLRGRLSVGEFPTNIPFIPKRYFLVYDVSNEEIRGEHAHKICHQFLICIKGGCSVVIDNGKNREEIRLESANIGLDLPPMIWACQYKYTLDAVLLVFASHAYDTSDYIRNYDEFIAATNQVVVCE